MKNSKWQKIKNILTIFFFIILFFLVAVLFFVKTEYASLSYEELLFHMNVPLDGSNTPFIGEFFKSEIFALLVSLLLVIGIGLLMSKLFLHSFTINLKIKKSKKTKRKKIKIKNNLRFFVIVPLLLILVIIYLMLKQINFDEYIYNVRHPSKIYEENYVDARKVNITFPLEKRNLIYIYVESLESSYADVPDDLASINNLIPNLEKEAKENVSFSDSNGLGGAYQTASVGWTMAGIVAQSAGIPLTIPISSNSMKLYKKFLPGVYSLGDILEKEGYNQEFMIGSEKAFGGRDKYFEQHGNYKIYDIDTAKKKKKIPEDYYTWWGFEDSKLFSYAKEEITNLANKDKPFNFQLLTVNTHFDQGYVEDDCEYDADNQFATSVICSDEQIEDFLNWLREQDFYDNTTIIITGDHLVMGEYLYQSKVPLENRRVYNAFINPDVTFDYNRLKNRTFTTLDMFPTTLSSLGVEIEGNRLGLGTNLFSSEPTLSEKMGKEKFTKELSKLSYFYNDRLIYDKKKKQQK